MYISVDSPTRSIRTTPHQGGELLLVGGESHKVGQEPDTEGRYAAVQSWMREHFDVGDVEWQWATQDPITDDHVPFLEASIPSADIVDAEFGRMGPGFDGMGEFHHANTDTLDKVSERSMEIVGKTMLLTVTLLDPA